MNQNSENPEFKPYRISSNVDPVWSGIDYSDLARPSIIDDAAIGEISQSLTYVTGNFGAGTSNPLTSLHGQSTTGPQLTLSYDANTTATFEMPASGILQMVTDTGWFDLVAAGDATSYARFAASGGDLYFSTRDRLFIFTDRGENDGVTVQLKIWNTAAGGYPDAHALLELQVDPTTNGDPYIRFTIDNISTYWSIGPDNSDSETFKICKASSLDSTNDKLGITTAGLLYGKISNALTSPHLELFQASTGDSAIRFTETGSHSYIIGIDNSDSDKFKISYGSAGNAVLGTNDLLTVTTAGAWSVPSLTISTMTQGSVLFAGVGGLISQNNAAFFWDNANSAFSFGTSPARAHTFGTSNLFIGKTAGNFTHTGIGLSVLIGESAGAALTAPSDAVGFRLTGVGYQALKANTTGWANMALGYKALTTNTTGYANTAVGSEALLTNLDGIKNTAVGEGSLYSNTSGNHNTAVGDGSCYKNTTAQYNVAVGQDALYTNQTGEQNTAIGEFALNLATGNYNSVVGAYAGAIISTGVGNASLGLVTLNALTTGNYNVAIGYAAGSSRAAITNCVLIGKSADATGDYDNAIAIGLGASVTASNSCVIGNSSLTLVRPGATATTDLGSSSVKWKDGYFSGQITVPVLTGNITISGQKLLIDHSGSNPQFDLYENGTHTARIQTSAQDVFIDAIQAAGDIVLRPDGQNERFRANATEVVVNDLSADVDFRVESDADTHAFFVDGGVGSVRAGKPSLATTATDGFLYVPACAGTPTGVPTGITGMVPIVIDHTNDDLLFNSNGAWHSAGSGGGGGAPNLDVYKTADETVTNSTALQDDNELTVNVEASTKYRFRFILFTTSASVTAGIKLALNGTCTVTSLKAQVEIYSTATSALAGFGRVTALGSSVGSNLGSGDEVCFIDGEVDVNAAGTFKLQWAQNTADAVNGTTVQKDSALAMGLVSGTSTFLTGTGISGRIAYWNSSSTLSSDGGLLYDAANDNLGVAGATDYGSGVGILALKDATTSPITDPAGGVVLYSEDGRLKCRTPYGIFTLTPEA